MRLLYRSGVAAHSRLLWIASSSMHGRASGKAYSSCDQTVTPGPSDLTKQPRAQLQYSESSKMIMPQGLASPATNNAEQLQQIELGLEQARVLIAKSGVQLRQVRCSQEQDPHDSMQLSACVAHGNIDVIRGTLVHNNSSAPMLEFKQSYGRLANPRKHADSCYSHLDCARSCSNKPLSKKLLTCQV
ncbi:hypothetical protein WJX79_001948 [Trebouxia sp. C0005]